MPSRLEATAPGGIQRTGTGMSSNRMSQQNPMMCTDRGGVFGRQKTMGDTNTIGTKYSTRENAGGRVLSPSAS